jgi:hypothetical protein
VRQNKRGWRYNGSVVADIGTSLLIRIKIIIYSHAKLINKLPENYVSRYKPKQKTGSCCLFSTGGQLNSQLSEGRKSQVVMAGNEIRYRNIFVNEGTACEIIAAAFDDGEYGLVQTLIRHASDGLGGFLDLVVKE